MSPASTATFTEVSIEPTSVGLSGSSTYHLSVGSLRSGCRPVGLTEVASGGSSGR